MISIDILMEVGLAAQMVAAFFAPPRMAQLLVKRHDRGKTIPHHCLRGVRAYT